MRLAASLALLLPALARGVPDGLPAAPLEAIAYHDNVSPAGHRAGSEWRLSLEVRRGLWLPNGPDRPGTPMLAFAEPGKAATIPGPLLRVPFGTAVRVQLRNRSDSTVVIRGLSGSSSPGDSLVLGPGAAGEARFVADVPGDHYYYGALPGRRVSDRRVEDGHLAGAFIVDPAAAPRAEHVIVLTGSWHSRDSTGALTNDRHLFVMNGRPWPHTLRLAGAVGDSMRFRIINASGDVHPMHLHGAYFRVQALGDGVRDTAYAPADEPLEVTHFMPRGTTMRAAWMPERPGTWLLHCHLTFHVIPNIGFGPDSVPFAVYDEALITPHAGHDPDRHVEESMGGLLMAITVPPPAGWSLPRAARRTVRMDVRADSAPGDPVPVISPVLHDERGTIAPAVRAGPGAPLLLREGEPTRIVVRNTTREPTAIHWHGMELESLYDGVVGLGGTPGSATRAVAPGDSFEVRMTPPRAGTFIYHTHFMEVRQQMAGLYGALIVLPRDAEWDEARDHLLIAGLPIEGTPVLNGFRGRLAPLVVRPGQAHRLRLINITTGSPNLTFVLVDADSALVHWTPIAKDGAAVPARRAVARPARQLVSMGETYDMAFTAPAPGTYRLRLQSAAGRVFAELPIEAR